MIVFCVVFCRLVIILFLLAIALPALALGDLKTLNSSCIVFEAKASTQIYMVRPYTVCKKYVTRVQFSIGFNLV